MTSMYVVPLNLLLASYMRIIISYYCCTLSEMHKNKLQMYTISSYIYMVEC